MAPRVLTLLLLYVAVKGISGAGSGILEDSERLEKYFRDSLEEVRGKMDRGYPEYNIPPMEPLILKDIKFETNHQLAKIKLHLHEIRISGLSGFQIQEMKSVLNDLTIQMKLYFPKLVAKGWYEVDGKMLVVLPVFGQGNYTITARDAVVGASGRLVLTAETMEVTDLKPHLDWGRLELDLKNFLGGGDLGSSVQKVIPIVGKAAFEHFKPEILRNLKSVLTRKMNEEMTKPEVKKLVQKVLEEITAVDQEEEER